MNNVKCPNCQAVTAPTSYILDTEEKEACPVYFCEYCGLWVVAKGGKAVDFSYVKPKMKRNRKIDKE